MTNRDLLTTEFPLTLPDGTVLRVQCLPVEGEQRIIRELAKRLYDSFGPGGYFAAMKGPLDYMLKTGQTAAYQVAVKELTHLTSSRTMPGFEAVMEFRETPDGMAAELFLRTRKTHPDLAEPVIRSQLNEVSAWAVYAALSEGLSEDSKRRSAAADRPPDAAG